MTRASSTRELYARIWETVLLIPSGRVASYGQVADVAGLPGRARLVGRALGELAEDSGVPWHRVIGASGRISFPAGTAHHRLQRALLEDEGVRFEGGRVVTPRWDPDADPA
jgi:methylated-DNA-protein-cysteine methyltransferase related protein